MVDFYNSIHHDSGKLGWTISHHIAKPYNTEKHGNLRDVIENIEKL